MIEAHYIANDLTIDPAADGSGPDWDHWFIEAAFRFLRGIEASLAAHADFDEFYKARNTTDHSS